MPIGGKEGMAILRLDISLIKESLIQYMMERCSLKHRVQVSFKYDIQILASFRSYFALHKISVMVPDNNV